MNKAGNTFERKVAELLTELCLCPRPQTRSSRPGRRTSWIIHVSQYDGLRKGANRSLQSIDDLYTIIFWVALNSSAYDRSGGSTPSSTPSPRSLTPILRRLYPCYYRHDVRGPSITGTVRVLLLSHQSVRCCPMSTPVERCCQLSHAAGDDLCLPTNPR